MILTARETPTPQEREMNRGDIVRAVKDIRAAETVERAVQLAVHLLVRPSESVGREQGRFAGNPKPLCQTCGRRIYGLERDCGWWCSHCHEWVVKPLAEAR